MGAKEVGKQRQAPFDAHKGTGGRPSGGWKTRMETDHNRRVQCCGQVRAEDSEGDESPTPPEQVRGRGS